MRPVVSLLLLLAMTAAARADGGTVRAARRFGGGQVTVFTSPTPLVAGDADVSVLVQDASGMPLTDVPVTVKAWPADAPELAVSAAATSEMATNKLLRAAALRFERPGPWVVEVTAELPGKPARLDFTVDVQTPPPSWLELLPWVAWPLPFVAGFVLVVLLRAPPAAAASAGPPGSPPAPSGPR